jgi:hypothetical protein
VWSRRGSRSLVSRKGATKSMPINASIPCAVVEHAGARPMPALLKRTSRRDLRDRKRWNAGAMVVRSLRSRMRG